MDVQGHDEQGADRGQAHQQVTGGRLHRPAQRVAHPGSFHPLPGCVQLGPAARHRPGLGDLGQPLHRVDDVGGVAGAGATQLGAVRGGPPGEPPRHRQQQHRGRDQHRQHHRIDEGQRDGAAEDRDRRRPDLGEHVGVDPLQALHVGHGRGRQVPAAPGIRPRRLGAPQPVEQPDAEGRQHEVGQVVGDVHLGPGARRRGGHEQQRQPAEDRVSSGGPARVQRDEGEAREPCGGDGRADGADLDGQACQHGLDETAAVGPDGGPEPSQGRDVAGEITTHETPPGVRQPVSGGFVRPAAAPPGPHRRRRAPRARPAPRSGRSRRRSPGRPT